MALWMRRLALNVAGVVVLSAGCTRSDSETSPDPAGAGGGAGEPIDTTAEAPLELRVREAGPGQQVPAQIVVRANKDLFTELVGQGAPASVRFQLTPEVPGTLTVTGPDTLTFLPAGAGFAPGTAYTAQVQLTGETPETSGAWTHRFQTPELSLVRATPHRRGADAEAGLLELALIFSAAVAPDEVARRVRFAGAGQALTPLWVREGDRPSEVRVRLDIPPTWDDEELEVTLAAGVPWRGGGGVRAAGATARAGVRLGPPVEILASRVKEGVSGFYIDVICKDGSLGEERDRYFWDQDTWDGWWVSERCELSAAEVAERVRISPAVALTVAPAAGGFRLFGALDQGDYTLEIDAGARTVDGGVLATRHEAALHVPARSPQVHFVSKGRYLPRGDWERLAIRHMNLSSITVTVRHIPPQNLAFWLSGDSEAASARTANTLLQQTIAVRHPEDQEETSWIDVGQLVPDAGRGVYEIALSAADGQAHDAARLLLTDLQLIAKRGLDAEGEPEARIWVLDARSGAPVQGAEVKVIRPSGQEVARCATPSSGECTLPLPADPLDAEATPMAIVVSRGDDLTYLKFSELEVQPEGNVLGEAFRAEAPYRAAVMTERGVYRPGETVRLTSIVREGDHTAPDAGLPVVLKVFDSRNQEFRREGGTLNAAGVLVSALPLTDFASTGQYRAELLAGDRVLGTASFAVEEFVPERMAVSVSAPTGGVRTRDLAPISVSARWLFGGSAADSRVELSCTAEAAAFRPEKNAAYHYGPASVGDASPRPVPLGVIEGVLSADGEATLSCPPAETSGATLAAGRLVARAAVFEGESGRSTVEVASTPLHPADHYIGLRANAASLAAGESATISGLLVDWSGEPLSAARPPITVELLHLEEEIGWLWDEDTGSSVRKRQLRRVRDGEQTVTASKGAFTLPFSPKEDAAGYLLVARTAEGAETELYIEGEGRRYWWEPGEQAVDQTPRPERPTPLELTLPETTAVGERVAVSVVAPYPGRLLWTVETDRVLRSEWVEVDTAGEVRWSFPVDAFAPNVYVSALLVKDPHLESTEAYLPGRAFAAASVRVRPEAHQQTVTLDVPAEIRPNSPLTVKLKVSDARASTHAVVAAVDEGVLQLTDFESLDPTRQLFAQRALGVETFETIGWSLADAGGVGSRTGGDMAGGGLGRVQMVKPVALWSGLVEVGADGLAEVTLDVPSYRGQLRVMAVTADDVRVGSASAPVTVRDPLVLQTTLPRFLVEGDLAVVPVSVTNTTRTAQSVAVRLTTAELPQASPFPGEEGLPVPVEVVGSAEQSLPLAPGESGTVTFQVRATRAFTAARFTVTASGGGESSAETLEVPLKAARAEERRSQRIPLKVGAAPVDVEAFLTGWAPGSDRSTLWLTANPYGSAFSHLRYLLRYPYGCIEQTTSSTRPLLYTRTLLEATGAGVSGDEVDAMIQSGIERVASMQTPEGGFAYWPGEVSPHLWASAYATHLLLDARDANVPLPSGLIERAVAWMGETVTGTGDAHGAAYAHYVLARAGAPRTADALRRLESFGTEEPESRTLLMAAVQQAGDRRFESTLRTPDLSVVAESRENSWRFYSDRRRRALTLNLLEELFPGTDSNGPLANLVADSIDDRESYWYTTQELAWAVSGLGKRVAGMNAALPSPALTMDGRALTVASSGAQGVVWRLGAESRLGDLSLTSLNHEKTLYLHINTDGVRAAEPERYGGVGLALTRTYLNGAGQPLELEEIALGELLYVRVDIRNTTAQTVQNIALVDRVPAGWELENPRLGRGDLPAWAEALSMWEREHMNLRDDRLEVFGSLYGGEERAVIYAVRAVTAGEFAHPPVSAEAMYDPTVWARQPGGRITIVGPWDTAM